MTCHLLKLDYIIYKESTYLKVLLAGWQSRLPPARNEHERSTKSVCVYVRGDVTRYPEINGDLEEDFTAEKREEGEATYCKTCTYYIAVILVHPTRWERDETSSGKNEEFV